MFPSWPFSFADFLSTSAKPKMSLQNCSHAVQEATTCILVGYGARALEQGVTAVTKQRKHPEFPP